MDIQNQIEQILELAKTDPKIALGMAIGVIKMLNEINNIKSIPITKNNQNPENEWCKPLVYLQRKKEQKRKPTRDEVINEIKFIFRDFGRISVKDAHKIIVEKYPDISEKYIYCRLEEMTGHEDVIKEKDVIKDRKINMYIWTKYKKRDKFGPNGG